MPTRDEAVLLDIAGAIRLVQEFRRGFTLDAFLDDPKTQSAILHQLLVLGEAVKRLSDEFRLEHPEIPWRLIAGMRDLLIHHYDMVDLEEVWRVADRDIPTLSRQIEEIVG